MTGVPLVSRKARANTKDLAHLKSLIITNELLSESFPLILNTHVILKKFENQKEITKLQGCQKIMAIYYINWFLYEYQELKKYFHQE